MNLRSFSARSLAKGYLYSLSPSFNVVSGVLVSKYSFMIYYYIMDVESEQEMIKMGRDFAGKIKKPMVIELVGDVGAGKTTFVRGLAEGLGVKEAVTSPSFTISKSYALPDGGRLVHYDFYRLPEVGIMADDLAENMNDGRNVVVIEWGESVAELLSEEHKRVEIKYTEEGRKVII